MFPIIILAKHQVIQIFNNKPSRSLICYLGNQSFCLFSYLNPCFFYLYHLLKSCVMFDFTSHFSLNVLLLSIFNITSNPQHDIFAKELWILKFETIERQNTKKILMGSNNKLDKYRQKYLNCVQSLLTSTNNFKLVKNQVWDNQIPK